MFQPIRGGGNQHRWCSYKKVGEAAELAAREWFPAPGWSQLTSSFSIRRGGRAAVDLPSKVRDWFHLWHHKTPRCWRPRLARSSSASLVRVAGCLPGQSACLVAEGPAWDSGPDAGLPCSEDRFEHPLQGQLLRPSRLWLSIEKHGAGSLELQTQGVWACLASQFHEWDFVGVSSALRSGVEDHLANWLGGTMRLTLTIQTTVNLNDEKLCWWEPVRGTWGAHSLGLLSCHSMPSASLHTSRDTGDQQRRSEICHSSLYSFVVTTSTLFHLFYICMQFAYNHHGKKNKHVSIFGKVGRY